MNHDTYPDNYIREILNGVKSIAVVGASPLNVRPSYFVFKYLAQRGYDMIPVNPGHVGKNLLDKPFVASLADIGARKAGVVRAAVQSSRRRWTASDGGRRTAARSRARRRCHWRHGR